jgi:ankyrin repeat protein
MSYELHDCAARGNLERVRQLVEGGANIDEVDEHGNTALSLANLCEHFEIVMYLVEHGANVARTDSEGTTALHLACVYGNLSVVKYLLAHGSRITDRDKGGKTALLLQLRKDIWRWSNTCLLRRVAQA